MTIHKLLESVNATIKRAAPRGGARCQIAKVGVKRWVNMCGHNIWPDEPRPLPAEPSDPAFVGEPTACTHPEGFEYEKKDGEYESTGEGSAWRTWPCGTTRASTRASAIQVESGVPTPLSWQLHSDFQSEEYRLAIVMLDVTGSALTARREWHSTPTHKDDAVPDGQSRVVNMLLFDIDSTASNTYEMLAGGLNQRMPKFGESSWGMDYTGRAPTRSASCRTAPPAATSSSSTSTATATRTTSPRSPRPTTSPSPCSRRSSATTRRVLHHARGVGRARYRKGLARRRDVGRRAVHRDALGVPVKRADGLYGSDDMRNGHNATEPCGAYGCSCEFSPGNCAAA